MSRIRKALMAGASTALGVVVTGLTTGGGVPTTNAGWSMLLGGAVAAGVAAGWATWKVRNET